MLWGWTGATRAVTQGRRGPASGRQRW